MINYQCTKCDASGVKLWRRYQTIAESADLLCADCCLQAQRVRGPIDENGTRKDDMGRTDQIGWYVPAVLTPDEETFWGYSSVPEQSRQRWLKMPTYPERQATKS